MLRQDAHHHLTDAAHLLRSVRPGMSLADAMELAALREPETAMLLSGSAEAREARGNPTETHHAARKDDPLSVKVRDYCWSANGKIDRVKLRAVAEANGVWRDEYEDMNFGSVVAAVMGRLRPLGLTKVKFP